MLKRGSCVVVSEHAASRPPKFGSGKDYFHKPPRDIKAMIGFVKSLLLLYNLITQ
jgi:hypothetical protein